MRLTLCAVGSLAACPPSRSLGNVNTSQHGLESSTVTAGGIISHDQRLDLSCLIFEALEVQNWL